MNSAEVLRGFSQLLTVDVDSLDRDEVATLVATSARLRSWHDSLDVRLAGRTRDLQHVGRAESPETMFGQAGHRSSKESDAIARRSDIAERMPTFQTGLANGDVSSGHLDAMASVRRGLDEAIRAAFDDREHELLNAATTETVDTFARHCREVAKRLVPAKSDADELDKQRARANVKRWVDKITGMHHTHLELDPLRDSAIWAAANSALATLKQIDGNAGTPWPQMQVNAFVAAAQGGVAVGPVHHVDPSGSAPGGPPTTTTGTTSGTAHEPTSPGAGLHQMERRVPEITLLADLETLLNGLHEASICETEDGIPLPASTVRRLCCDAEIIPAVMAANGEILDLGRSTRTVNRPQRRALRAMHRTCAHTGCTVPFSATKAHHVRWWVRDRGPTDICNLLPLCEKHHHLVHEGRWTLSMTPDRVATWIRPDGTVHHIGSTIDRRPGTPTANRQGPSNNRPADRPMLT